MNELTSLVLITACFVLLYLSISYVLNNVAIALALTGTLYLYALCRVYLEN